MRIPSIVLVLLTATALLAGCGGADKEEIFRAREYVRQLCQHQTGDNGAFDGLALVKSQRPFEPVPAGTMVAVGTAGAMVDGVLVAPAADLADGARVSPGLHDALREQLQVEEALAMRDPSRQPRPLVVAFDAGVPASAVGAVLNTLFQLEIRQVLLAFEPTAAPPVPPPPDRALADELSRLPEDQLPLYGANKMAELAADCAPLTELFNVVAFVPPEQRCDMLANSLGEVFGSSSCSADIGKVLTLFHAMFVPRRPVTTQRVALHPDAPGIPVQPTTPWSEIAAQLFARGGERIWLEIAPAAPPVPAASAL